MDNGNLYGDLKIRINNITDNFGNSDSYTISDKVYFDNRLPEIKEVNITGGKLADDKTKMSIYCNQKIVIDIMTSEELGESPEIYILGNKVATTKLKNKVKDGEKEKYYYFAEIDSNNIINIAREAGYVDRCIPVEIKNYKSLSGRLGETWIIGDQEMEELSTNEVYLFYGDIKLSKLYLASDLKANESEVLIGDINQDGYINEYDYLLLERYLIKLDTLTDSQKQYANVDGKNSIETNDLTALQLLMSQNENSISIGKKVELKAYTGDNEQITGDNLSFSITQGEDLVTCINENNKITIIPKNKVESENGIVTVKATYFNEEGTEQKEGEMSFKIKKGVIDGGGFEVISDQKTERKIAGDINQDGFVTYIDAFALQEELTSEKKFTDYEKEIRDVNKDGTIDIRDIILLQLTSRNRYNDITRGDSLKLKFKSQKYNYYNDFKDESIEDQIKWSTEKDSDMITIIDNHDGSADIKVKEDAVIGSKIVIYCKAKVFSDTEEIARINIEITDKAYVNLSTHTINYDLSKLPDTNTYLKVNTNLNNKAIEWNSSDENVAKLKKDEFGNVEVIPVKEGTAKVTATVDGITDECEVKVEKSITKIYTSKQDITLKESLEEEEYIIVNSITKLLKSSVNEQQTADDTIDATEEPIIKSSDEDIVRMYKDEETGAYKILAISEGEATLEISSPTNEDVKETINVNVKPLKTPIIKKITIDQDEGEQEYRQGEKINIKIAFSEKINGDVPELQIGFGNKGSIGNPEFIQFEDDNTAIRYEYEVQEGDNGILNIIALNGGSLTDDTGKMESILTVNSQINEELDSEEMITEIDDILEEKMENSFDKDSNTISDEKLESKQVENIETLDMNSLEGSEEVLDEKTESSGDGLIVPNGIHLFVGEVIADTIAPEITVVPKIEKDSYYLNKGDIVRVNITSNEDLAELPTVTIGGQEATVEGSGKEYTASLEINDKIKEGYLEIKVSGCRDLSGNETNLILMNEENMDEPIVIDYSKPAIKTINIMAEEGKNYKVGDKVKIKVVFEDENMKNRNEYIKAEEVPALNIRFGRNKAEGNLESDYTVGEYVNSIIYTYTILEKDIGKMTINNITGNIEDAAGNKTDLSKVNISNVISGEINEIVKQDDNNGNDNKDDNNKDNNGNDNKDDNNKDNNGNDNKDDNNKDNNGNNNNDDENKENNGNNNKTDNKESNSDKNNSNNINANNKNNVNNSNNVKYSGKLPYTGSVAFWIIIASVGVGATIAGVSYIVRKKHYIK